MPVLEWIIVLRSLKPHFYQKPSNILSGKKSHIQCSSDDDHKTWYKVVTNDSSPQVVFLYLLLSFSFLITIFSSFRKRYLSCRWEGKDEQRIWRKKCYRKLIESRDKKAITFERSVILLTVICSPILPNRKVPRHCTVLEEGRGSHQETGNDQLSPLRTRQHLRIATSRQRADAILGLLSNRSAPQRSPDGGESREQGSEWGWRSTEWQELWQQYD